MTTGTENRPVAAGRRSTGGSAHVPSAPIIHRPVENLLSRLDGVRQTANGWVARCPAHEDRRPSLSIAEGADGRVLVRCFAGCPTEDVVRTLGLTMADLFPRGASSRPALRKAGLSEAEVWRRFKAARHRLRLALATMIRETEAAARRAGPALFDDDALVAAMKRLGWREYLLDVLMGDGDTDEQLWAVAMAAEEVRRHGRQG